MPLAVIPQPANQPTLSGVTTAQPQQASLPVEQPQAQQPIPVQQPTPQQTLGVLPAQQTQQIATVGTQGNQKSLKSISNSISLSKNIMQAQKDGANPDDVLSEIVKQNTTNPTDNGTKMVTNISEAQKAGASSQDILAEILKQNYGDGIKAYDAQPDPNSTNAQFQQNHGALANFALGAAETVPRTIAGLGKLGDTILGGITGKGVSDSQTEFYKNTDAALAASGTSQKVGQVAGDVGQFFVPGVGEEDIAGKVAAKAADALDLGSGATKAVNLASKGVGEAAENAVLAKGQGQSNKETGVTATLSAVSPTLSEGVKAALPAIKDLLGGEGTAVAQEIKSANPELTNAWQTGKRTVNDLAGDISNAADQYETQGKKSLQAIKDSLPDVKMPKTNLKGGIQKIIDSSADSNLTAEDERTITKLQNYVEKNLGKDNTSKGVLDLKTGIDNGGFFKSGNSAYSNSNKVVSQVRQYLNDVAIDRMENYDTENGTNFANEMRKGLSDATDRINFMDKFRANLVGNNPETYVEQTSNKVRSLINKAGDPSEGEATKELLSEFEDRIGQPGKFTNEFNSANAAKILKGLTGRLIKNGIKIGSGGLGTAGIFELIHHYL